MPRWDKPPPDEEFFRMLAEGDSLRIVIEGAIAIESEIRAILEVSFHRKDALEKANLTYDQQIQLLLAAGLSEELAPPLRALGRIRNQFAHRIMPPLSSDNADALLQAMAPRERDMVKTQYAAWKQAQGEPREPFAKLEPADRFILCVVVLRAALITARRGKTLFMDPTHTDC